MELTVFERLILLEILPSEGDFLTLKIVRKMREDLSFSEEEHKNLQFVQEENLVRWNKAAEENKPITFGEKAISIIKAALNKLNNDKKLTEQHFTLYEKFIEEE